MNYLKKLFMLTVLAQGVYVKEARANENIQAEDIQKKAYTNKDIQEQIHGVIEKHAGNGENDLAKLLSGIQADLKIILSSAPDTAQYKQLKEAVHNLNPSNLLTMIGYVRIILANIAPETKFLIMKHVPKKFQAFVA